MAMAWLHHVLTRLFGLRPHDGIGAEQEEEILRGESILSSHSTGTFIEEEPRAIDWIESIIPTRHDLLAYAISLFPFISWIDRYNLQWLTGDLVAGITIGAVVVPQGMAYAILANLPPEYGLYTSFMGVLIYWFFATSKDITIGPVAVMSTLTGQILSRAAKSHPDIEGHVIASALAIVAGGIITFIGLIRCGWIVDLIPLVSIAAFVTGSAVQIAAGQVPTLLGITGFDTRAATYHVVINTLRHLSKTKIDAAMGITALVMLYLIRFGCNLAARRQPQHQKAFFFLSTLRTAFVILLYTMISWLVNRHRRDKPLFRILKQVPRGFRHASVPRVDSKVVSIFASDLPATVIVLLIEHIAISKSFGRINNYTINPSQELVAIGVTNLLGPFLGAYPATGSFSRTAIKSKAGVRTPFAGVITAVVVLLAIYALTAVFYYIPSASLSAVIIHAVLDLITPPSTLYKFWRVSPLEVPIFLAGVLVTVFSSIDNGIYTTISAAFAVMLFRIIRAKGTFLGTVQAQSFGSGGRDRTSSVGRTNKDDDDADSSSDSHGLSAREIFLPLDHEDGSNPTIDVQQPSPGVFIYRFSENLVYPNVGHYLDHLTSVVFAETRRTNLDQYIRRGDRPWNDPGPRRGKIEEQHVDRPILKAIILDFSSVNNVDVTTVQNLIDVRNQLNRYASPATVDWHFACIRNRWTKRALGAAGFGFPSTSSGVSWKPIYSIAKVAAGHGDGLLEDKHRSQRAHDLEQGEPPSQEKYAGREVAGVTDTVSVDGTRARNYGSDDAGGSSSSNSSIALQNVDDEGSARSPTRSYARRGGERVATVSGINRPLFHIDLVSALQSAMANIGRGENIGGVTHEHEVDVKL